MMRTTGLIVTVVAAFAASAWGWWDTQIMMLKDVPAVASVAARDAAPADAALLEDGQPPFGPVPDGKVVKLEPGKGTLTWRANLKRSVYVLFVIARVPEAQPEKNPMPEWPVFGRLKVTGPDGKLVGDWSLATSYLNTYYDTSRLYFPADQEGAYTLEYSLTDQSKTAMLVDRLVLRDVLGNTFQKGFKTARHLWTDEEVAQNRRSHRQETLQLLGLDEAQFSQLAKDQAKFDQALKTYSQKYQRYSKSTRQYFQSMVQGLILPDKEPRLDPAQSAQHQAEFDKVWGQGYQRWNRPLDGMVPFHTFNKSLPSAQVYLDTGSSQAALETVNLLLLAAGWYPAIDYTSQNVIVKPGGGSSLNRQVRFTFTDSRFGKDMYSGWSINVGTTLALSYDAVFPFLDANADQIIPLINRHIPWIKTKADLIGFLDTRLLQHIGDCVNRGVIRASQGGSETVLLQAAIAQGPNPAGNQMMNWLFTRTYMSGSADGGLQDHAISSYNRDGSNRIGSVGYTESSAELLVKAALYTRRFVAAGGDSRFDLSNLEQYPAVVPGAFFPLDSRLVGGVQPRTGDWGRAFDGRIYSTLGKFDDHTRLGWAATADPRMAWLLVNAIGRSTQSDSQWAAIVAAAKGQRDPQLSSVSRNLRGFGLAILEDGSETDDILAKRALTFRWGVGKGHAHADSLSLDFYSHGVRLIPDVGNRGGAPHPGHMNAHLGVSVDDSQMHNSEINTSGTAWTDAFLSAPGAQYVSGAARFGTAPQVQRYQRQAALVDIAGQNASYVFDVLRVAGGKLHTWHTHGPPAVKDDTFQYNLPLQEAQSDNARKILGNHANPREGKIADVLVSTWTMDREFEKRMIPEAFRNELPPVTARSTLFNHNGAAAYIGNSIPDKTGLENSSYGCTIGFVHVQPAAAQDNLQTVWPQLIEGYRGQPLIQSSKSLPVSPEDRTASAPVALAIATTTGQNDLILADGDGRREVKTGQSLLQGRFGYVSTDAKGIRLAHLVAGTRLQHAGLTITADQPVLQAVIQAVDYSKRQITLDRAIPANLLVGQEIIIGSPARPQPWKVQKVDGAVVTLTESAVLFQSEILSQDEKTGQIICSIEPPFLVADSRYYDGVTIADESGKPLSRVGRIEPKFIWMYMQEPVQDWTRQYTLEDFPDADGDGKRMVKITNWGGEAFKTRPFLELQVAQVDVPRQIIYFNLPQEQDIVDSTGWNYSGSRLKTLESNRWLVNEKGWRLQSNYAGKTNVIQAASPIPAAAFADADKDGRKTLRLYHYGPGDRVELQTHVYAARQADGQWIVKSTAPGATVTLPDGKVLKP